MRTLVFALLATLAVGCAHRRILPQDTVILTQADEEPPLPTPPPEPHPWPQHAP